MNFVIRPKLNVLSTEEADVFLLQIPHERFSVAEVARLRGFGYFGQPEFWQIRLQKPHYFLAWGISMFLP